MRHLDPAVRPPPTASDGSRRIAGTARRLSVGGAALIAVVAVYMACFGGTSTAQTIGDVLLFCAAATAAVSCAWAARRADEERRAWTMLAVAASVWALAQIVWTVYGVARNHAYPFPSVADLGYVGYVVPAVAALLLFPKATERLSSRLRTLLDALVIAIGVLFVSWASVLHVVYQAGGQDSLAWLTGLAYPAVDVLLASLVLTLGMRRPAGQRIPWLFLGGGLVVLTVTDSTFVSLVASGDTGATGTPMVAGWMTAWFLVALSPWVPRSPAGTEVRREVGLVIELVPYVPVFFAIVVSARADLGEDRFLLITGAALLVAVTARQMMIVYENMLTRDLQIKVALRNTELAGLGSIVQSSSDAIIAMSVDGTIEIWNPGAGRLFGHSSAEILGRHIAVLTPADQSDQTSADFVQVLERVRRGEQINNYEAGWLRADGTVVPAAFTFSPIREGDVVQGISAIGQDVTQRRAAQADLESARGQALESSRLKSEFLATMSHEIRTPMNGVIGLTNLLLDTPLDETQRQYAEGVQGAGEALLTVINDILDFSKLEAGKVELELADFDPRQLVEEVASLLAFTAHSKGLELVAYCQPEVPKTLVGDCGRIRQILLNLASNAVKFTAAGEVVIAVRASGAGDGRELIGFQVADTGIGISAEARSRLFESFSQADASTTRRFGGTGLGLAISRRLTEAMDGQIGVDSEEGSGSTFWFQVPLAVTAHTAVLTEPLTADRLTDLPVLIVDDNATNRLILQSQLSSWRMRPDVAEHPHRAVSLMRDAAAAGHPYAIAVLDMCMPDIDGLELARMISADETIKSTRLIMLTSTMQLDAEELRQAGVREWLTKPVRSSEFYDRLMRLLAPTPEPFTLPVADQMPRSSPTAYLGRVLVVEDNAVNQLVAEGVLSKLGYQVDLVANGAEALEAIAATPYAAVLMDCHMPVMDGFTATEEIRRRQGSGDRVPIIAMTAGAMAEDRERCLAVGMDDYVAKPVNVNAISDALARWVSRPLASTPNVQGPEEPPAAPMTVDQERQSLLRGLGPDDGWGLLPAAVDAFLQDCPDIMAAMRDAAETGNSRGVGESAHQLKGAASNIGLPTVTALCTRVESSATAAEPPGAELLAELEGELVRAAGILHDVVAGAR